MIKAIFNGIFNMINSVLGILLTPINLILSTLFPNIASFISLFNSVCDNYLIPYATYFFHFLPPITRNLLAIILTFMIAYKTIVWSYRAIVYVFDLIRKVKFW